MYPLEAVVCPGTREHAYSSEVIDCPRTRGDEYSEVADCPITRGNVYSPEVVDGLNAGENGYSLEVADGCKRQKTFTWGMAQNTAP